MKPPSLLFLSSGFGMLLVAVVAVWLAGRGKRPLWRVICLLRSYGSLAVIPLAIFERITTLLAHVFSCVPIVMSVRLGRQRWFWLSFAYKTALDGVAAWAILAYGVRESVGRLAQTEAILAVFALVAVAGLAKLRPTFPEG